MDYARTNRLTGTSEREFVEKHAWRTGKLEYPFGRGMSLQIVIRDGDRCYRQVQAIGYPIKAPIEERWYRVDDKNFSVKQFLVMDPDGFLLRFQQNI